MAFLAAFHRRWKKTPTNIDGAASVSRASIKNPLPSPCSNVGSVIGVAWKEITPTIGVISISGPYLHDQAIKNLPMTLALDRMRELWEFSPELSATAIGARFGVSKNVVIGHASRRGWKRRRGVEPTSNLFDARLAALHADMDAVLAETQPAIDRRVRESVAA